MNQCHEFRLEFFLIIFIFSAASNISLTNIWPPGAIGPADTLTNKSMDGLFRKQVPLYTSCQRNIWLIIHFELSFWPPDGP